MQRPPRILPEARGSVRLRENPCLLTIFTADEIADVVRASYASR
jgi:hypothetical protein